MAKKGGNHKKTKQGIAFILPVLLPIEAGPKKVAEERQGVVKLHLFVVEGEDKGQRSQQVAVRTDKGHGKKQ